MPFQLSYHIIQKMSLQTYLKCLTDGIFENGAYGVPSKSQKPNHYFWVKVVHLVPKIQTLAGHSVGTIRLAPTTTLYFDTVHKTKGIHSHIGFFFIFC